MADILEFGIRFNIQEGAEDAKSQLKKVVDEIGKGLGITVDFEASAESIKKLKDKLTELEGKNIDIITDEQRTAINGLVAELVKLEPLLNRIEQAASKQSQELAKTLSTTTKAAIEEEKLAQAKEKTAQAQEETARKASLAAEADNKRLISAEKLSKATKDTSLYTEEARKAIFEWEDSMKKVEEAAEGIGEAFKSISSESDLEGLVKAINELAGDDLSGEIDRASRSVQDYDKTLNQLGQGISYINNLQRELREAFRGSEVGIEEYRNLNRILESAANQYRNVRQAIESIGPPAKEVKDEIEQITTAFNFKAPKEWSDAVVDSAKTVSETRRELEYFKDTLKGLYDASLTDEGVSNFAQAEAELKATILDLNTQLKEQEATLKTAITLNADYSNEIVNQEGSLNALNVELSKLIQQQNAFAPNTAQFRTLGAEINRLRVQAENIARLQGNLAQSSRTWGRNVVDLTYAVRLFNPTAGILVQRFQRISTLGILWNRTLAAISKTTGASVATISKFATGIAGAGIAITLFVRNRLKAWKQAQEEMNKSLVDSAKAADDYAKSIKDAYAEIKSTVSAGQLPLADASQVKDAINSIEKIIEKNESLNPIVKERLSTITDENEKLKELIKIWEELNLAVDGGSRSAKEFAAAVDDAGRRFRKGNLARNVTEQFDKLLSRLQTYRIPQFRLNNIAETLKEMERAGATYGERIEYLRKLETDWLDEQKARGKYSLGNYKYFSDEVNELTSNYDKLLSASEAFNKSIEARFRIDLSKPQYGLADADEFRRVQQEIILARQAKIDQLGDNWTADGIKLFKELTDAQLQLTAKTVINTKEFEGWKKALKDSGEYTDDIIDGFAKVSDATRDVSKRLVDARKELSEIKDIIATTPDSIISPDIEEEKTKVEGVITALEALQIILGKIFSTSKTGSDTRHQELMAEVDVVKQATQAYEKLLDVYSSDEAAKKVNETYGQLIQNFEKLPKDFELQFDGSDVTRALETALDVGKDYLKKAQKLKIGVQIQEEDVKDVTKQVKRTIDQINADIKKQQEANKIFQDILGLGVSQDIAADFTLSATGRAVENIRKELERSIKEAALQIKGLEIPLTSIGKVDYAVLEQELSGLSDGYEQQKTAIQGLISQLRAYDLETFKSIYSGLDKLKTAEEQKTRVVREETERRRKIREEFTGPEEEKQTLLSASQAKEAAELDKITYNAFKSTELYVQAFSDLDKVSTPALKRIEAEFIKLQGTLNNLDPAQLKEIQNVISNVQGTIIERNPFVGLGKDIKNLRQNVVALREAEVKAATDLAAFFDARDSLTGIESQIDAQRRLIEEMKAAGAATEDIVQAEAKLEFELQDAYDVQKEITGELEKQANTTKKQADTQRKVVSDFAKKADEVAKNISGWASNGQAAIGAFEDVANIFGGVSDATKEILDGISQIVGGLEQAALGALEFAKGIALGGPAGIISAVSGGIQLISGLAQTIGGIFSGATARIKAANKEIERQQKIIDNLTAAYSKLQRAQDKALGQEKIDIYQKTTQNQYDQIAALEAQIAAERDKGKKADEDKIKAWEEEIIRTKERIEDELDDLIRAFAGTDVTTAATAFANAWLDAYISFSDTVDAIKGEFKNLIKNMLIQAILSKAIGEWLEKNIFREIEERIASGKGFDKDYINKLLDELDIFSEEVESFVRGLLSGLNIDALRDLEDNISGIQKQIASITEDTAIGIRADLAQVIYYMLDRNTNVQRIVDILEANFGQSLVNTNANLIDLQQQSLSYQMLIQNDVALIRQSNDRLVSVIESVINLTPGGMAVRIS